MMVQNLTLSHVLPLEGGVVSDHTILSQSVARAHRHKYLLLDPCRVFALRERIDGLGECLPRGKAADGLEDAFPWIVQVDHNSALMVDFLSDDTMQGLWSADAGLLVCSDLEFAPLMRHLRKFYRCQIDESGNFVLLRYWEPELLARLVDMNLGHIRGLVTPQTSVIARYDDTAHVLTAVGARAQSAWKRPDRSGCFCCDADAV